MSMQNTGFEEALTGRIDDMLDACTKCGACFKACPIAEPARAELPDVVFYTGCNVLKTPHIALLCLDIMDAMGIDYKVMGGPTHCCGTGQLRAGDTESLARFAANTINKLSQSKTGEVLA